MSHSHEHVHDESTYYVEQLATIGVCGLLGVVAVLIYYQDMLRFILAPYLHVYVLWSGFGLLGLVAIRGVSLFLSVGRAGEAHHLEHCHDDPDACDHDHDHGHEHGHEHEHEDEPALVAVDHHHDASCDHGHSHGWRPWRYIVLCLPIGLFVLNFPNQEFSSFKALDVEESDHTVKDKGGGVLSLQFKEMERWAYNESQREFFEGQKGRVKGQFAPGKSNRTFGLVRSKITCCSADVINLNVAIICKEDVGNIPGGKWVEVTGQIQFRKRRDREEYVPVLEVQSRADIRTEGVAPEPYLQ